MSESEYKTILSVMANEVDMLRFRLKTVQEENDRLDNELRALQKEANA